MPQPKGQKGPPEKSNSGPQLAAIDRGELVARGEAFRELFYYAGNLALRGLPPGFPTLEAFIRDSAKDSADLDLENLTHSLGSGWASSAADVAEWFLKIQLWYNQFHAHGKRNPLFEGGPGNCTGLTEEGKAFLDKTQQEKQAALRETVAVLAKVFLNQNPDSRRAAASALGQSLPSFTGVQMLQRIAEDDAEIKLREFAAWALNHIRQTAPPHSPLEQTTEIGQTRKSKNDGKNNRSGVVTNNLEKAEAAYRKAVAKIDEKREQLASEFQTHFNTYARALPTATYEEKKAAKDILNAELRSRGFAVKCLNTGAPSTLLVRPGDDPAIGRWLFAHTENGVTKTTSSSVELPYFQVILEKTRPAVQDDQAKTKEWVERRGTRPKQGQDGRE